MRGLHVNFSSGSPEASKQFINLLAHRPGMEIMYQQILKGATVCLAPGSEADTFEFFYVISGSMRLILPQGSAILEAGASFYADQLDSNVSIEAVDDTALLYITNKPLYENLSGFQVTLHDLMKQVDDKDHYTYHHSRNVMNYSVQIARKINVAQPSIDMLLTSSLFHDVGKCYVPDNILKKSGPLTPEEYQIIKRHPLDSAYLLEPHFGKAIADAAQSHHERLDGSGYPLGLTGDQISLEGRIIAVADSFDSMTDVRIYNKHPKSFLQAAQELYALPHLYDNSVAKALLEMVENGELKTNLED